MAEQAFDMLFGLDLPTFALEFTLGMKRHDGIVPIIVNLEAENCGAIALEINTMAAMVNVSTEVKGGVFLHRRGQVVEDSVAEIFSRILELTLLALPFL